MVEYVTGVLRDTSGRAALGGDGQPVWLTSTQEVEADATPRAQRGLPPAVEAKLGTALNTSYRFTITRLLSEYGPGPGPIETGGAGEEQIRTPMNVALGIGYGLRSGFYDPTQAGYTEAQARALAHRVIDGTSARWGSGAGKFQYLWQSMLWTQMMVEACWALGDVPAPVVARVAAAHQAECEQIRTRAPSFWLAMDGSEITPGDTKAEECAWMGLALYQGYLSWPEHPSANQWRATAVALLAASTTALADLASGASVHSVPLASVFDGANVLDNGGVHNHGIVHPAYVMSMMENQWQVGTLAGHRGQATPEASLHAAERQYRWLVDVVQHTGQTVYIPGSGQLHFPDGPGSHPAHRVEHAILSDVVAHCRGLDSTVSTPAVTWAGLHLDRLIFLQGLSPGGHAYGPALRQEKNLPRWLGLAAMTASLPPTTIYTGPVDGFPPA